MSEIKPWRECIEKHDAYIIMCNVLADLCEKEAIKKTLYERLRQAPSTDCNGRWMSFEQVADMLSRMFGRCACDVNGNDEWLPLACKYADTECPNPKEENGCWMQFLLQGGADMRGG